MIKDKLKYTNNYCNISEKLKMGFEWLKSNNLDAIDTGKHIIGNDGMYVNVESYNTKTDANYEAHRKYIDIQYMINGVEYIGVTDIGECRVVEEYDNDRDIEFLVKNGGDEYQVLKTGDFIVLFPNDAHKPSISPSKQTNVRKAVVKVPVN